MWAAVDMSIRSTSHWTPVSNSSLRIIQTEGAFSSSKGPHKSRKCKFASFVKCWLPKQPKKHISKSKLGFLLAELKKSTTLTRVLLIVSVRSLKFCDVVSSKCFSKSI